MLDVSRAGVDWRGRVSVHKQIFWGGNMTQGTSFTQQQCERFQKQARPAQWLLTAHRLHVQALELYARRGQQGTLIQTDSEGHMNGTWPLGNKATFLLCAFALENAIKAFLVYEYQAWISNGELDRRELKSHRLVALSKKSHLIPDKRRDEWVLTSFEKGSESWMRYPCSLSASDLQMEQQLHDELWNAYLRVMCRYGLELKQLINGFWKGPHGALAEEYQLEGTYLGCKPINPLPS
jgi:hypothetical protein